MYGDFLVDQANDFLGVPGAAQPGAGRLRADPGAAPGDRASSDPDDDVVVYHLEIYSDEALSGRVAEQLTDT